MHVGAATHREETEAKTASPTELAKIIESYLAAHPAAALLEDGRVLFDMRTARYSVDESHGRCLLELWSDERSLVRTVVEVKPRAQSLRLATRKMGAARPQFLELTPSSDRRTPTARDAARRNYQRLLERVLTRQFIGSKVDGLRTAMDLEHSFGPAYVRGRLLKEPPPMPSSASAQPNPPLSSTAFSPSEFSGLTTVASTRTLVATSAASKLSSLRANGVQPPSAWPGSTTSPRIFLYLLLTSAVKNSFPLISATPGTLNRVWCTPSRTPRRWSVANPALPAYSPSSPMPRASVLKSAPILRRKPACYCMAWNSPACATAHQRTPSRGKTKSPLARDRARPRSRPKMKTCAAISCAVFS